MRVELSADDLALLKQALDLITIKGKDAHIVSKMLTKLEKAFEKEVTKGKDG